MVRVGRGLPATDCEVGARTRLDPSQAAPPVMNAVLDVERAVPVGIVRPLGRRHDPEHVVVMDVRHDLRQRRRLVRIPAVHLAQLERPEDHVRRVVVVEDPDVADPDRLTQALVVISHERLLARRETIAPVARSKRDNA